MPTTFPWWMWISVSLACNVAIIRTEYLNRISGGFLEAISQTWYLIVFAQLCLFFTYNRAPSLMMAWIVFTIGNSLIRLTMAGTVLGEPLNLWWAIAGAGLMIGAGYCIKMATA